MFTFPSIVLAMGLAICALALGQLAFWSSSSFRLFRSQARHFEKRQAEFRKQLSSLTNRGTVIQGSVGWQGYRNFVVDRLVKEAANTTSVYLLPADGKPITSFLPGQHLTIRLTVPGQAKPVVRCYTLSDGPGKPYYRISVKEVPPPAERPALRSGKASEYINRMLQVGDIIEAREPSGEFYLNEDSNRMIVLLAGGIGITPMISILEHLVATRSSRTAALLYGVRNGSDHPFKDHLSNLARLHDDIHVLNCYSNPQPQDKPGTDFQVKGFVSVDLLQKILSHPDAEFYLCGPPPFMRSVYDGLLAWGVASQDIRLEAFGPASIKTTSSGPAEISAESHSVPVKFVRSDQLVNWTGKETLLELAEQHQIPIDSGCRAGSCGSCSVALLKGEVEYPGGHKPQCAAGHCLMCIARPKGGVEVDL